jgi:1-acyl-sn-glycerol-3-phosphate acyltransferase
VWSTLRSTYAWILLSVIVLPLFPVAFVHAILMRRRDADRSRLRVLVARWVSLYARSTPLYRFEVEHRDRIPATGPYVLVANHESGLDVLTLLYLRTTARFLADAWLFKVPLAGPLMQRCRHIRVDTSDRESGREALEEVGRSLAEGTPVAIFPEGRLMPDGMGAFMAGAFVAAQRAGVPIVPVLLEGAGNAWRPGTLVVRGAHEIRIAVLPPVPAEDVKKLSTEALSARVRSDLLAARLHVPEPTAEPSPQGETLRSES